MGTYNFDTLNNIDYPQAEVSDMARQAREVSANRIYHVMLRGINQTELFYDSDDRKAFLQRLKRFKDKGAFELYAYALMGNHVHLLLREGTDTLALIIKRLTVSYSYAFNAKYLRSGYLFQGRYKSEPVDDDTYLLTVFKYIHHNPIKIGKSIDSWTSYNDYMKTPELVDTGFILDIFADTGGSAQEQLRQFLDVALPEDTDIFGEARPKKLTDEVAIARIKGIANLDRCNKLAELDKASRDEILVCLKREGFTVRQLSRLTGINRGIIQKAKEAG
jgi:REP element-mobilizing transposase RayT